MSRVWLECRGRKFMLVDRDDGKGRREEEDGGLGLEENI